MLTAGHVKGSTARYLAEGGFPKDCVDSHRALQWQTAILGAHQTRFMPLVGDMRGAATQEAGLASQMVPLHLGPYIMRLWSASGHLVCSWSCQDSSAMVSGPP